MQFIQQVMIGLLVCYKAGLPLRQAHVNWLPPTAPAAEAPAEAAEASAAAEAAETSEAAEAAAEAAAESAEAAKATSTEHVITSFFLM